MVILEFTEYPRKVKISEARKAKYFISSKVPPKAKKYSDRNLYKWEKRKGDKHTYLYDVKNDCKVVANPKAQGTSSYEIINAQRIYNQHMSSFTRSKVVRFLHNYFKTELSTKTKELKQIKKIADQFPLKMKVEIHDTLKVDNTHYWDAGNRAWLYNKAFEDVLTGLGVIKDDNILFISRPPSPVFIPVNTFEERKLVFIIEAEDDPRIIKNKEYIHERENYNKLDTSKK